MSLTIRVGQLIFCFTFPECICGAGFRGRECVVCLDPLFQPQPHYVNMYAEPARFFMRSGWCSSVLPYPLIADLMECAVCLQGLQIPWNLI